MVNLAPYMAIYMVAMYGVRAQMGKNYPKEGMMSKVLVVIGVLALIFGCAAVVVLGVLTIKDIDLSVEVDRDYIPPAFLKEGPQFSDDSPQNLGSEVTGRKASGSRSSIGSITIGSKKIIVPSMTQQFSPSDYPRLFTVNGEKVTVAGPVVVHADDFVEYHNGTRWVKVTSSVSEYAMLPEGTYCLRISNISGLTYVQFLEQLP